MSRTVVLLSAFLPVWLGCRAPGDTPGSETTDGLSLESLSNIDEVYVTDAEGTYDVGRSLGRFSRMEPAAADCEASWLLSLDNYDLRKGDLIVQIRLPVPDDFTESAVVSLPSDRFAMSYAQVSGWTRYYVGGILTWTNEADGSATLTFSEGRVCSDMYGDGVCTDDTVAVHVGTSDIPLEVECYEGFPSDVESSGASLCLLDTFNDGYDCEFTTSP